MDTLPEEVVAVIFHQLSIPQLTYISLVTKKWMLITNNSFWKQVHQSRFGSMHHSSLIWRTKVVTDWRGKKRNASVDKLCLWAVDKGYICLVKKLFANPEIISQTKTNWGLKLLISSIESISTGAYETTQFLLKYVDPNGLNEEKNSPLHIAVQQNKSDICELLIKFGADIELKHKDIYPPLFMAASRGHKQTLRTLLDLGSDPNYHSPTCATAVYVASEKGYISCIKELCNHTGSSCDIEIPYQNRYTPLFIAAERGHTKIVKYLLSRGANVEGNMLIVPPLFVAAANGHTPIVKLLLKAGANVERTGYNGLTPLYIATQNGYTKIVKNLCKYKANPNAVNNDGISPLYKASENCFPEVVNLLLKNGADPHITRNGVYPLHVASEKGCIEVVKQLAGYGVNIVTREGSISLHYAVEFNQKSIILYLINEGSSINVQDNRGYTPLHLAVGKHNIEFVKILVENGADIRIRSKDGMNPIMLACKNKDYDIITYLVDRV